jgi:hypothetical protein
MRRSALISRAATLESQRRASADQPFEVVRGEAESLDVVDRVRRVGQRHLQDQADVAVDVTRVHDLDDQAPLPFAQTELDPARAEDPHRI